MLTVYNDGWFMSSLDGAVLERRPARVDQAPDRLDSGRDDLSGRREQVLQCLARHSLACP